MRLVRTWLPLTIILAGVVLVVATGATEDGLEGGALLVSAGLSVWLLNLFFRVGVKGDLERDAEDRARDFYDEHGYWPDEAPAHQDARPGVEPRGSGPPPEPHRPGPQGRRARGVRRANRRGP